VTAGRVEDDLAVAFESASDHLRAELGRLAVELGVLVRRRRQRGLLAGDPAYRGLYVPEELVDALLVEPGPPVHREDGDAAESRRAVERRRAATPASALPLARLASDFGLDQVDLDILVLAAAVEVDSRFAPLLAWLQDDVSARRPAVSVAADLWSDPYDMRERLGPGSPLVSAGLVSVVAGDAAVRPSLLDHVLVLDSRVLRHLLGDDTPATGVRSVTVDRAIDSLALPDGVLDALVGAADSPVLLLTGPAHSGRRATATAWTAFDPRCPGPVRDVVVFEPGAGADLPAAVLEARLSHCGLVVCASDELAAEMGAERLAEVVAQAAAAGVRTCVIGATRWHHTVPAVAAWPEVELGEPGFAARRQLWRWALAEAGVGADEADVSLVADAFALGPGQIASAAASLAGVGAADARALAGAARSWSVHHLDRLARRVDVGVGWSDLVLPPRTQRQVEEIVAAVRHRPRVQQGWGMGCRRGLAVLFAGPTGTGKTMTASLIAGELGLDMFALDLAAVVSKYIGETEKNLDAVFAEARASNAVLLFDEADALFGRRSEVKDAHDRYANLETAYLLQRVEAYDGLVVLTTNFRSNLDEAFARRLAFVVEFAAPDMRQRARLWRVSLPPGVPLDDDVDLDQLAERVELSGSQIANSAVAAAYLAAAAGEPVAMRHLVQGIGRELQKSGRAPSRSAFGPYYRFVIEPGPPAARDDRAASS